MSIIELHGPTPNELLIQVLEDWLKLAKAGDLHAVAMVGLMTGGRVADAFSPTKGAIERFSLAGGMNFLATKILLLSPHENRTPEVGE